MSGHVLSRTKVTIRSRRRKSGWLAWLAQAMRAIETRRRLAEMDDRMLKDIGVSRGDALEEANRAPWDLDPRLPWDMR
ncbi:MAG TPA: DUF1127 domain-containing protein [Falsiroseomonas sp.]|jgi:uncharacterized protein YjiS (DUF1127 family)|nr:DUF1127 domain-containing protein [Falsiroseomonas sp.]